MRSELEGNASAGQREGCGRVGEAQEGRVGPLEAVHLPALVPRGDGRGQHEQVPEPRAGLDPVPTSDSTLQNLPQKEGDEAAEPVVLVRVKSRAMSVDSGNPLPRFNENLSGSGVVAAAKANASTAESDATIRSGKMEKDSALFGSRRDSVIARSGGAVAHPRNLHEFLDEEDMGMSFRALEGVGGAMSGGSGDASGGGGKHGGGGSPAGGSGSLRPKKGRRESVWVTLYRSAWCVAIDSIAGILVGVWGVLLALMLVFNRETCYVDSWDSIGWRLRIWAVCWGSLRGFFMQLWPWLTLVGVLERRHVLRGRVSVTLALLDPCYRCILFLAGRPPPGGTRWGAPLLVLLIATVAANCRKGGLGIAPNHAVRIALQLSGPVLIPAGLGILSSEILLPTFAGADDFERQVIIYGSVFVLALLRALCGVLVQFNLFINPTRGVALMVNIIGLNSVLLRTLQAGLFSIQAKVLNALMVGFMEFWGPMIIPYMDGVNYVLLHRKLPTSFKMVPRRKRVFADIVIMANKLECAAVITSNGYAAMVQWLYNNTSVKDGLSTFVVHCLTLLLIEAGYEVLLYLLLVRGPNVPVLKAGSQNSWLSMKLSFLVVTLGSLYFATQLASIVAGVVGVTPAQITDFCADTIV